MANPQAENGHIDIANEIADRLCSFRISGQEWQIIWVVLRKTWGWLTDPNNKKSPKKKMDRIALSQFEKYTNIDRRKCHTLLKRLVDKKIIIRAVTQKGDKVIIRYGFQKDYDKWKLSPKKVTVTQKGDGLSPKKVSKLSPKKVNTKDTLKETITKEIYNFYKTEINPTRKSATRAKKNIKFYLKKYSQEQLIRSIKNYKTTCSDDPDYRKDPANFFGRNDQYFIDYLDGQFEAPKKQKNLLNEE